MATEQAIALHDNHPSLVEKFAHRYSVDPAKMLTTLKATAFRQKNGQVTNEQMMALLVVADQYKLNPFCKEIYAFPDKQNGVIPIVGVDGWSRIINQHSQFDGMEFNQAEKIVNLASAKPCPEWIECVIYRKDRTHPIKVREHLDEVYRPPFKTKSGHLVIGPWGTHTKRFLRHKAMIQCARMAFGYVGIYDQDEAERIHEAQVIDVTPGPPPNSGSETLRQRLMPPAEEEDQSPPVEEEDIPQATPGPLESGEWPVDAA